MCKHTYACVDIMIHTNKIKMIHNLTKTTTEDYKDLCYAILQSGVDDA